MFYLLPMMEFLLPLSGFAFSYLSPTIADQVPWEADRAYSAIGLLRRAMESTPMEEMLGGGRLGGEKS